MPFFCRAVATLRQLLFWLGMLIVTPPIFLLALLAFPSFRLRYWIISRFCWFFIFFSKYLCKIDVQITGLENLPSEPCIIAPKHQSTWETCLIPLVTPPHCIVAKRELLWIPIFGWGMALVRPILLNRRAKKQAMLQLIAGGRKRLLDQKQWVVIYPEGTRVPLGKKHRYGRGAATLAVETGCALVPIAHNAGKYWHANKFTKTPGVITVKIGKPIVPTEGCSAQDLTDKLEAWIEENSNELLDA